MPARKPALGRGLEAIFGTMPGETAVATAAGPSWRQVPIEEIQPNPFQPREDFDPDKLSELAASIKEKGILQPLLLRRKGQSYEIIAGERRWRAGQQAGLRRVPAMIRDFDDKEMMEAAMIENIQRDDLNPVEEARGYERLTTQIGLTQEALASVIGKSRTAIANTLRLLRLPIEVLDLLQRDKLSAGHGRALLSLSSRARQISLAEEIVQRGLSVREAERITRKESSDPSKKASAQGRSDDAQVVDLQNRLIASLGLKVKVIPRGKKRGKVEIFYASIEEFETLCERLGVDPEDQV